MGVYTVGAELNEVCWLPGVTNGWIVSGLPKGLSYKTKTADLPRLGGVMDGPFRLRGVPSVRN